MKKIFALILAIVMIASMSVVVFAETVETQPDKAPGLQEGSTILTYGVAQDYIVTIPPSTDFDGNVTDGYTAEGPLSVTGVKIAANEEFTISVKSKNAWMLVDTKGEGNTAVSAPVVYDIFLDDAVVSSKVLNDETTEITTDYIDTIEVLTVESTVAPAGNTGDVTLNFFTAGTGQEGIYKDELTFIVAIDLIQP